MPTFRSGVGRYTNRDADSVKWNQAWDRYLEQKFRPLPCYPGLPPMKSGQSVLNQSVLASLEELRKQLCTLQFDLAVFATAKRKNDNFDAKWPKMSPETREKYILQGLVISCGAVADMEERREGCPETTMKVLQKDGGRGFLNLLATVCPPTVAEPRLLPEPILIAHPVYDAMMDIGAPCPPGESEAARTVIQNYSMINRNYFITFFLWNTMLYIYGQSQRYGATKNGMANVTKDRLKFNEDLSLDKQSWKNVLRETKESRKTAQWHCTNCSKPEEESQGGKKFLACSKCQAIGRKVKYCDRDCQLNDWKKGNPPHKTICGKPIGMPEAVKATPLQSTPTPSINSVEGANVGPPPADPGFIRSKALQQQISFSQDNPGLSYVLMEPAPKADTGIQLPHPMGRLFFEVLKNRAMKNGDPQSVAMMYGFLQEPAKNAGFSNFRLLLQLSKEYGISVDKLSSLHQTIKQQGDKKRDDALLEELVEKFDFEGQI